MAAPRELSFTAANELLSRNAPLSRSTARFYHLVGQWNGYDQVQAGRFPLRYGIPPWGKVFTDSYYGDVIVFPDARGDLRFVVDVPPDVAAAVEAAPYRSDPNLTFPDLLADLTHGLGRAGDLAGIVETWLPVVALAATGAALYSWMPKRR